MTRHAWRRRSSRALLWALAAMFACEAYDGGGDATLVVVVRVEPTAQAATAFPAQVLVGFDSTGVGFVLFRVGFVCTSPSEPFVLTARFQEASADGPTVVDAWLVPADVGTPAQCGALPAPERVASSPPRTAGARTSADVAFLASCGSEEVRSGTLVFGG